MHMRVMALIMEGGEPPEMLHRDFQILGQSLRLRPQHIPPAVSVIEAEPFGVLSPQGQDCRPYISLMEIQFFRYIGELDFHTVICKEPM